VVFIEVSEISDRSPLKDFEVLISFKLIELIILISGLLASESITIANKKIDGVTSAKRRIFFVFLKFNIINMS
jgi:hypothetical protein